MATSSRLPMIVLQLLALLALIQPLQAFWNVEESAEPAKEPQKSGSDTPVEYGVDISFPMHHSKVSNNYAWLPHNTDSSVSTPWKYKGMAVLTTWRAATRLWLRDATMSRNK